MVFPNVAINLDLPFPDKPKYLDILRRYSATWGIQCFQYLVNMLANNFLFLEANCGFPKMLGIFFEEIGQLVHFGTLLFPQKTNNLLQFAGLSFIQIWCVKFCPT